GRQYNGNLHLSEFRLQATKRTASPLTPALSPLMGEGDLTPASGTANVSFEHATADFNQSGWEIDKALDGNIKTAWGIYPEVGKSHFGVFETKSDLGFQSGTRLTFTIEQQHGGGHLIGRVRLSITSSPRPVRAKSI